MRPHRRLLPLVLVLAVLTGCEQFGAVPFFPAPLPIAAGPVRWSRAAANYDEFLRTRYFCLETARWPDGVFKRDVFFSCMEERGFRVDPYGPFWAPPGELL